MSPAAAGGYIITNHHVADGAKSITVTVRGGQKFSARMISKSVSTDLALLKVNFSSDYYLNFAKGVGPKLGDRVFTMGYPVSSLLGKNIKYTEGAVNSLFGINGDATFMQISVPIQPGNSGGPLVNQQGNVVGIVTSTAAVGLFYDMTGSLPQNINWAVKGDYALMLLPPDLRNAPQNVINKIENVEGSTVFIEVK